jgi:hypothetical protein
LSSFTKKKRNKSRGEIYPTPPHPVPFQNETAVNKRKGKITFPFSHHYHGNGKGILVKGKFGPSASETLDDSSLLSCYSN